MIRKGIAEFIGTALLVIFGCGTVVALNTYMTNMGSIALPFMLLAMALAFGLTLTALVYTIGKVSGCHVNPAVSIACLIDGRMNAVECISYIICQFLGSCLGAEVLVLIFNSNSSLGTNGYGELSALSSVTTLPVALAVEIILTFVFVLVVLSTTKKENNYAGIVIGLTLTLVHIFGLPFTGTSVNPARSFGPAVLAGGTAFEQVWVFIVGPIIGGILAALFYRFVISPSETEKATLEENTETEEDTDDEEFVEVEEDDESTDSEDDFDEDSEDEKDSLDEDSEDDDESVEDEDSDSKDEDTDEEDTDSEEKVEVAPKKPRKAKTKSSKSNKKDK